MRTDQVKKTTRGTATSGSVEVHKNAKRERFRFIWSIQHTRLQSRIVRIPILKLPIKNCPRNKLNWKILKIRREIWSCCQLMWARGFRFVCVIQINRKEDKKLSSTKIYSDKPVFTSEKQTSSLFDACVSLY